MREKLPLNMDEDLRKYTDEPCVYHLSGLGSFMRSTQRVLDGAVPPLAPGEPSFIWPHSPSQQRSSFTGYASASSDLSALLEALRIAIAQKDEAVKETPKPSDVLLPDGPAINYGWVCGCLPAPDSLGQYVVEFVERRCVRVLAYMDKFGRVFGEKEAIEKPPAREPDLRFVRSADQDNASVAKGCVEIRNAEGQWCEVAAFEESKGLFTLYDTWFDFGPYAQNLSYRDALARAYLAFVYRPALGAPVVPSRGLEAVENPLGRIPALSALRTIAQTLNQVRWDPALRPPALAQNLARWLDEAGLSDLDFLSEDALRLVKTTRYANIYYLGIKESGQKFTSEVIWRLQNALNRYLLIWESLGQNASLATTAEVLCRDASLIESVVVKPCESLRRQLQKGTLTQAGKTQDLPKKSQSNLDEEDLARLAEESLGRPEGNWVLHKSLAQAAEELRAPLHFDLDFRSDLRANVIAIKLSTPDASFMPRVRWDESSAQMIECPEEERRVQALRYALHLGLYFAATAFVASSQIQRVELVIYPLRCLKTPSLGEVLASSEELYDLKSQLDLTDDMGKNLSSDALHSSVLAKPQLCVSLQRNIFLEGFMAAAKGDPYSFFKQMNVRITPDALSCESESSPSTQDSAKSGKIRDPFLDLGRLASAYNKRNMPEFADGKLPGDTQKALGASWVHDLRIDADAYSRRQAREIAHRLVFAQNASDAIRMTRQYQEEVRDVFVSQACTRLMRDLAEGFAEPGDQNTITKSFIGEDLCADALRQAQELRQFGKVYEAAQVLGEATRNTELQRRYFDNAEVVYRNFDSYAARILYNLARRGDFPPASFEELKTSPYDFGQSDCDKKVELVPDALLRCHLEVVKLLEHSFSGIDTALEHALRAVKLAPTSTAPRCLLARAYMLMGDMHNASAELEAALGIAVQPYDIAIAYYQLAYTLWKSGDATSGAACYVKSIGLAPTVAAQAALELQQLIEQEGVGVPLASQVDEQLRDAGIPVAPLEEVLELLLRAAAAACDAGIFSLARPLLVSYMQHKPDDALMGLVRSLADVPV